MNARPPLPPPRAVLFDLDGTLLDTAPDLTTALNRLRQECGAAALPLQDVRHHVSHGADAVVRAGFPGSAGDEFAALKSRFLELYRAGICIESRLFPGFESTLQAMETAGIPWGIVTNKAGWLTDPLLQAVALAHRAGCVVAGDSMPERKPHPRPLLVAAALLHVAPEHCIFVGDAERDIVAARAAGMLALGVHFGYLGVHDTPDTWQADGWLTAPGELLRWLGLPASA